MRRPSRERDVSCVICGAGLVTRHSQGKYCSPACTREGARKSERAYAERNRPARRAYHRSFYRKNRDRVLARTTAYKRTPAGRRARRRNDERQREKFPERYAARQAVLIALRTGRIRRERCTRCGDPKTQAHHHDYSKPLEIEWLCRRCHDIEGGHAAVGGAA